VTDLFSVARVAIAATLLLTKLSCPAAIQEQAKPGDFVGWATNGPVVYQLHLESTKIIPGQPLSFQPPPADLPVEIRRDMLTFLPAANLVIVKTTSNLFDHFLPESLNNLVWTNFIAHTNGRSTVVWSKREHPLDWRSHPPILEWNTNNLMWGMRGLTAISPCWESASPGIMPVTALTRRHGYTRGHGMGEDRIGKAFAGKRVWFLTSDNTIVERKVVREIVRTMETCGRDYTILLFASDLPDSVEPMQVMRREDISASPHSRYVLFTDAPCPLFKMEWHGNVSAEVPGFSVNTLKPPDSGSPNMLALPDKLVFWTGRSSSGASPEMQADMDRLCELEGLDPKNYQMHWVDLSSFPAY